MRRCLTVLLLILSAIAVSAAQSSGFRFEREVIPGGPGPNRIAPDVALLSGVAFSDLRDLRFYDSGGKETPYLLIPPAASEPRWKTGKILPVAATQESSGFEVDLGAASLIDRLRLAGIPTPFLKRFRLEGSGDRSRWTLLVAEGTLFDLPDENLRFTDVPFDAGEYRYLRVTWDDRKSGRVPEPKSVSVRLVESRAATPSLRAAAEFKRVGAATGRSRFQARLPGAHLPIVAVELTVAETRLHRSARVTESQLMVSEVVQQTLGSTTLRRVSQNDLVASDLRIPISGPTGKEIEIVVDDDDNPPLELRKVELVFAPQPWIYLESARGESLRARYGDARLTAPRYDLEAMRQYVNRGTLKDARWGEPQEAGPASQLSDAGIEPGVGGTIDVQSFRYSRQIPPSPQGLTTLPVDLATLAGSQPNLYDLRIADASGNQIPYLLESRQDPLIVDVTLTREDDTGDKQTQYRVDLPFEMLPAAKLVLTTSERVFRRTVTLKALGTKEQKVKDRLRSRNYLSASSWRHDDPDSAPPPLSFTLPARMGTKSITLTVDEGDNRPLPIAGARLELPAYHVRFVYPEGAKLTLLYGNERMAPPQYDLQLLASRLVGVASREISLEAKDAPPIETEGRTQTLIFWIALAAAVITILLLLARLLRSEAVQS
jgi:hypothetical protein